jgi:hypothetical protein
MNPNLALKPTFSGAVRFQRAAPSPPAWLDRRAATLPPMAIEREISPRQSFVVVIVRGLERETYRSRPTKIRERPYFCVGRRPFSSDREWTKLGAHPGKLPRGVIVGSVEIADCRRAGQRGALHPCCANPCDSSGISFRAISPSPSSGGRSLEVVPNHPLHRTRTGGLRLPPRPGDARR